MPAFVKEAEKSFYFQSLSTGRNEISVLSNFVICKTIVRIFKLLLCLYFQILSPDILSGGEEDLDKEDQPERHKGEEGASEHKSESGTESSSNSHGPSSSNSEASSASHSEHAPSSNSEVSSSNAEASAFAHSEASPAARSEVLSSVRSEASSSFRVVEAEGK